MYKIQNKTKIDRRFNADGVYKVLKPKEHIFVRTLQRDVEEYENDFEITVDVELVEIDEKLKTKKVNLNGKSR